jgi:putative acetyltransferase
MHHKASVRRLATETDLEQVFAIYMHAQVIPFLGADPLPIERFRFIYEDLLASNCFFVYEVSDRIAGFYKVFQRSAPEQHVAYLSMLALNPAMQGRGIGRAMLADAIAKLSASGVTRVELRVENDNTHAIGFYRNLGFECTGIKLRAYQRRDTQYVDEMAMALTLE